MPDRGGPDASSKTVPHRLPRVIRQKFFHHA
jgi:hypothetical protein